MTRAVVLDIEGTTTAISFVYDVLFPYAAAELERFVTERESDPAVREAMARIREDRTAEEAVLPLDRAVIAIVRRQMAADVKATGLKMLQGLIWRHGYESGAIKGHVFADVPDRLAAWRTDGRKVAIYSSGSVLAQRLLFGHSVAGDLSGLIDAYFDTTTGPKREAASYTAIATALGLPPDAITFCTDQPGEADAAAAAGLTAILLMRPGNPPLPPHLDCPVHADLNRI